MNIIAVASGRRELFAPQETHTAWASYPTFRRSDPAVSGDDRDESQLARVFTFDSRSKLAAMRSWSEDWDGNGSAKPNPSAIANAEARLPELYRLSTRDGIWREPLVSASEDGEVTFEWWSAGRKITAYFGENHVELILVWGANVDTEMELVRPASLERFQGDWAWLYGSC